ncbi:hypothetical protein [Salinivirga cyanobacteriivorans]
MKERLIEVSRFLKQGRVAYFEQVIIEKYPNALISAGRLLFAVKYSRLKP